MTIIEGTLGKAFGVMGGYIAADKTIIDVHPQLCAGLHLHHLAVAGAGRRRARQRPPPQGSRSVERDGQQAAAATPQGDVRRGRAAGDAVASRTSCR